MSADANTQTGSTDNDLNVRIAALGLTGNDRYIRDLDQLADKAESAIKSISGMNGRRVDNVIVRDNWALKEELEARLDDPALPDVEYYQLDWRRFLDDDQYMDDNGKLIRGARLTAEQKAGDDEDASEYVDDPSMAEVVAASDADLDIESMAEALDRFTSAIDTDDEDEPLDDFDAETDEFVVEEHFDLRLREHRQEIPMGEAVYEDDVEEGDVVLTEERINRAKARARGVSDDRLYADYLDRVPTVNAAIFLHDSTSRGMVAVEGARGQNPWVSNPSKVEGQVLEVNCNMEGDSIIDWSRYLLENGTLDVDDLTDDQIEDLFERHTDDDLEWMGFEDPAATRAELSAAADPEVEAGAPGQPAAAD